MTDFASAPAALSRLVPLDPTKHVKYTRGMVLGVDDFDQEFSYLSGRDRWQVRDLHGFGTVWGLAVVVEEQDQGPRVNVAPGVAVTPCGQLVCVSPAQCADLNEWLAAHQEPVRAILATSPPGGMLTLYVVLCYRECPTDDLPIPGEPCRTEDTLAAPSRLKDDFRLELRTTRPRQAEEDAIRDFVGWLRQVPVVQTGGSSVAELLDAIRDAAAAAAGPAGSPPSPPASPPGSPPAGPLDVVLGLPPPWLAIPAGEVTEYLRAAFGLWATELRPALRRTLPGCEQDCGGAGTCGCGCDGAAGQPGEPCLEDVVLLAALDLQVVEDLGGGLVVASGGWSLEQAERPTVLHTRILQEWLLSGGLPSAEGSPPGPGGSGTPISAVLAHEVTGAPTASFDAASRILDLGIPAGAGIDEVVVTPLPPGSDATVLSFTGGVLTLGIAAGRDGAAGPRGPGITSVALVDPPLNPGDPPTASLAGEVLTLGLPPGQRGLRGLRGKEFVVAAARFQPDGTPVWTLNGLQPGSPVEAIRLTSGPGLYFITFAEYDLTTAPARYAVNGTVVTEIRGLPHFFEVVEGDEAEKIRKTDPLIPDEKRDHGFFVRIVANDLGKTEERTFTVQVSQYPKEP
jgi:hypothetical protein